MFWSLWFGGLAHAGCHGAIAQLAHAWGELAVPVSTSGHDLGPTATVLAEHGAVATSLKDAKGRAGRAGLPDALAKGEAWLDANPGSLGAESVRALIGAAREQCAP